MTETAKLEALIVDELFADLRDRRFLKWLFKEEESVIGDFPALRSLDLDVQQEIREAWTAIISRALFVSRPAVKGLEWGECAINRWGGFDVPASHGLAVAYAKTQIGTFAIVKGSQSRFEAWLRDVQISGAYDTLEAAKAAAQSDFEQRILSSLSPPTGEMVLVPKSALDWLNGEGLDANGHHFGDAPDDFPKDRAFWWRTKFRALIDAPLPSPPEAE